MHHYGNLIINVIVGLCLGGVVGFAEWLGVKNIFSTGWSSDFNIDWDIPDFFEVRKNGDNSIKE